MKKTLLILILSSIGIVSNAQYFQATMKVDLTTTGPEAVFYITPNSTGGNITDGWTGIEFFITFPPAYSLTFGTSVINTTNFPGLSITDGGNNVMGPASSGNSTNWFYYSGTATTSSTYTAGVEYEVFRVPITGSTVDFGDISLEYDGTGYTTYLSLTGSIGTGYTTADQSLDVPVYYGSGTYTGSNGDAVLSGGSCQYEISDKPLISMVLYSSSEWNGGSGVGNEPGNGDAAKKCYVKDVGAEVSESSAQVLNLIIETGATLSITPNAGLTANGSTTITDSESFIIQATTSGVGSFIDNGTITYGGSGTAKVQTFLSNSAGVGNYDLHLVGPTVDEASYTGSGTGAYLEKFIITGADTYAYEWNEAVADDANAWVNLTSLTDEIHTAKGIGLSTTDNTNHTLEMTGELMTGSFSSPSLTFSNNHWELISNPYPSSIDFDALQTLNSGTVNNKFSLWNPAANSWVEYAGGAGADKFIQVGQGFFVETNAGGTFDFTNTERAHSNNAFRETMANILTVTAAGGMEGYHDVAIVRFDDEATSGYDINMESEFWESQNSDATSLRTVAEGNIELAINVLPTESLHGEMLSVPLNFDCGYTTTYTLTFEDFETFEFGTEIYLEDTQTTGEWVYLNDNPIYTFEAAEQQNPDRFIIHFFGPTDINELNAEVVDIYSYGQNAYVRNNTQDNIKMIYVYNLSGELIMSSKSDNQKFIKLWVSDQLGYYIVRVVTNTNIYTEKVLIFK